MNQLPDTLKPGDEIEVQIAPHGSFPGSVVQADKRREIIQRLDPADIDRIVAASNAQTEILVDRDHTSDAPGGSTEAMAWIHGLRHDPERGLVGILRPTDIGAEALANRRYRFLSPVLEIKLDGDTAIPVGLLSVALTNTPNLPVACVLNRAPAANSTVPVEDHQRIIMDKLRELLGLEAGAGDDAILEAVAALKTAVDEAKAAQEAAAAAALQAEAETVANANAGRIANRDQFIRLYIENKDFAAKLLAVVKAPPPPARVTNSAEAKRPAGDAAPDVLAVYNSLSGRERRAFLREHAAEIEAARREAAK